MIADAEITGTSKLVAELKVVAQQMLEIEDYAEALHCYHCITLKSTQLQEWAHASLIIIWLLHHKLSQSREANQFAE